ncbi:MAG: class I SAM-dependent methyltransferase [bacterium]|nr:class I SAM-dependent methyltransferase [bacterium]
MAKKRELTSREKSEKIHFDEMAKLYDENYTYNTAFTQYKIQKKLAILFSNVDRNKKFKILEIGAGTGEYTQHLAQLFPKAQITAIDISPKILEVAKAKCKKYRNIRYQTASVYELPYADQEFDFVCGFYILHHLNLEVSLREVHRVLKKDAEALFYEPNILNPVVFAIKEFAPLKKLAGDSPDEWAINPLSLHSTAPWFSDVTCQTTEFIAVPSSLPFSVAVLLDKVFGVIGKLPFINLLGGSVSIKMTK